MQLAKKQIHKIIETNIINQNCIWFGETLVKINLSKMAEVSDNMHDRRNNIIAVILLRFNCCCSSGVRVGVACKLFFAGSNLTICFLSYKFNIISPTKIIATPMHFHQTNGSLKIIMPATKPITTLMELIGCKEDM